jgi:hypothetical protein
MHIDKFTRAMSLLVELQSICDNQIRLHKAEVPPRHHQIIQLATELSCSVSNVYDNLIDYIATERVEM